MASLIPAIGVCVSRMTGGEKRLAYRLEQKLEDDWLLWYDVPLGPRNVHPDFVVTHLKEAHKTGIPVTYQGDITFGEQQDTVKFLTMHGGKGLEFPLVAIPRGLAGRWMTDGKMRRRGCCMWR